MRPDAMVQKPRSVAHYLQKLWREWLVTEGEQVTWGSPLWSSNQNQGSVNMTKTVESHMIRASVDLRIPKQLMERHKIT